MPVFLKDLKIGDCFCFSGYAECYIILDFVKRTNLYGISTHKTLLAEVSSSTGDIFEFLGTNGVILIAEKVFLEKEEIYGA